MLSSLNRSLTSLSSYDFRLPEELIAQHPLKRREDSRLLVIDRNTGKFSNLLFHEIEGFLNPGDALILNNTKVIPALLTGFKDTGGKAEVLLIEKQDASTWKALVKPAKKLKKGTRIRFSDELVGYIIEELEDGFRLLAFPENILLEELLMKVGRMPLPPYIKRKSKESSFNDDERYQTTYAKYAGSLAAPTAGLHFSSELRSSLQQKGIQELFVTLHVGLGTFLPVKTEKISEHKMHRETYVISSEMAAAFNEIKSSRRHMICIGTTSLRTLESVLDKSGKLYPIDKGSTDIFIYPGHEFLFEGSLLTNFHLPKSTLMMLVCAFGGYELMMEAYQYAIKEKYRFFSYGDAMLIL